MFGNTNMLILKVTRDCNLRCKYCYVNNKDDFKGEMMTFETFKVIIQRVIKDLKKSMNIRKIHTFSLIFHGGEPLLLGRMNFSKFLSYASREFKKNNIDYSFGIQTNLTLITDDILMLLHEYNVGVGVSFDGIKESNSARTNINTDKFEKYFKKLEEFNVQYGFLIVANKSNINNLPETYDYIFDKYKINNIKVNYAEDVNGIGESEVLGKEFWEKAWMPILDSFLEKKYNSIFEDNINEIVKKHFAKTLIGVSANEEHISNCGLKTCGGGMNIIEINPNGDVYYCGRYSEDYEEVFIQNVKDKEFLELKQINRFFDSIEIQSKLLGDLGCDLCDADNICDHGCMAFHYSKFGEFGIRDDLVCQIFKPLQKYLVKNEVKIFERLYEVNKNQDGVWYLNLNTGIKKILKSKLLSILYSKGYNIEVDPDFSVDDKTLVPQLRIENVNIN